MIAFIGSVFSPYYAWARRRGPADPANHCSLNVALYGRRGGRWCMTERGAAALSRDAASLCVGPSSMRRDGDCVRVSIDEVCAPLPRRIRGEVSLMPSALGERSFALDRAGRHLWTPYAPCARVEVKLSEPDLQWSGVGYLDSNCGAEPLEAAFREWTWSRAAVPGGTVVLYDVSILPSNMAGDAQPSPLALRFGADAIAQEVEPPPRVGLPRTGWRVARTTRADAGGGARVVRTLEDAPFYSRSLLETRLYGATAPAVHESLDLGRFSAGWVQCLLPFRMPRRVF